MYWPRIDDDIANTCRNCTACAEHQNNPPKTANHPWIMPEKPWSRIHIDHAINFMGKNWLIMVDAYSKYPCMRPTTSVGTKATTDLLEEEFAHFGFPLTIVSDNATSFKSDEFQEWCASLSTVEFVYNGFAYNVNLPTTSHFAWSRQNSYLLCTFRFAYNGIAYNVNSNTTAPFFYLPKLFCSLTTALEAWAIHLSQEWSNSVKLAAFFCLLRNISFCKQSFKQVL